MERESGGQWCLVTLVVAMLMLVITLASCSGGTAKSAGVAVDDLARTLSRGGDDIAEWEQELRSANGGRSTVKGSTADQLVARSSVVADVWAAAPDVADVACQAWTSGGREVLWGAGMPASTVDQGQALLDQMYADTEAQSVTVESVTMACELYGAANSGL